MYIYDHQPSGSQSRFKEQLITSWPAQRNPYYFDRDISGFSGRGENSRYVWADQGLGQLSSEALSKRLMNLSFLPHFVEVNGKDLPLTPAAMDPGIYDGPEKYKIAPRLQDCLKTVMALEKGKFRHIKVALVDLTKDPMRPEFAAFDHKQPVIAASIPKIAAMLAAHQLLQDLRVAAKRRATKPINDLFKLVRQDWADTQRDLGGGAIPFTRGVSLRGKLVLVDGRLIPLVEPKAPRLEEVFEGTPKAIKFKSSGEGKVQLDTLVDEFNLTLEKKEVKKAERELRAAPSDSMRKIAIRKLAEAKAKLAKALLTKRPQAQQKLAALGFLERMRVMAGGLTPASNFATSTIVHDVGFLYIASTLLQCGLHDPGRNGGLWLGTGYWPGTAWSGLRQFGAETPMSTAGSLAAFMTLLVQNKLVSPQASASMRSLIQIQPVNPTHPTTSSWFEDGLSHHGSLERVFAKIGFVRDGFHECAYIARAVDCGKDRKGEKWELPLRYVAVGLGAKSARELKQLIDKLDACIRANNRTTSCVRALKRA